MKRVARWTLMLWCMGWGLFIISCSKPESPSPVFPAEVLLDNLDRPQAMLLEEARQKVLDSPQSGEAWGRLGQHFDAVDFDGEAMRCYERAAVLEPRSARWPYLLGLLQLPNDPESGLFHLRRAVQLADVMPDTPRLRLAQALIERGQTDQARPHLERLLGQIPGHPAARLEVGRIELIGGNLEGAAQTLTSCLTNSYTARPAMLLLAQIRQRQGQDESARALAQRAGAMPRPFDWPDPYLREVLRWRVDRQKLQDHINGLLMSGRLPDAEAGLQQLLGAFPDDAEGLLLLGRLRFLERKCDQAEMILRRHLEARNDSLNGLIQLALAVLCQERWGDAAQILRQAVALKPDFAEAHYNLGYALVRAGDAAGARRSFTEALRCRPGYVDAHAALAEELFRAGDDAAARDHVRRALELDPGNARVLRLRSLHPSPP